MNSNGLELLNSEKVVIDLCGGTGAWSDSYAEAGYDRRIITLPEYDVRLYVPPDNVYGVLAAPPCTEFSFAKHFHGKGNYNHDFLSGLAIVDACLRIILISQPKFWALENPKGYLRRWLGEPTLTFEPWWYGDNWRKATDLWGEFNEPHRFKYARPDNLVKFSQLHSKDIYPEFYGKLSRQERRAITPPNFARAFYEANR